MKQKQIKIKKESRIMGATVNGVKYISNGHWMMRQDLVEITSEMAVAMEVHGHFKFFSGRNDGRMDVDSPPVDFKTVMGKVEMDDLSEATHVNVVFPDGGIPGNGGLTPYISEDNPEHGVSFYQVKYLEPLKDFKAYRETIKGELKPIRFYRGDDLIGLVMPCMDKGEKDSINSLYWAEEHYKAKIIEDRVNERQPA